VIGPGYLDIGDPNYYQADVTVYDTASNSDSVAAGCWLYWTPPAIGAVKGLCVLPTPNFALPGYLENCRENFPNLVPGTCIGIQKAGIKGCFSNHPINDQDGTILPANMADIVEVEIKQDFAVEPQATYSGFTDRAICFWLGATPDQVPNTQNGAKPFVPHEYSLLLTR
jgi:hypothetical protein